MGQSFYTCDICKQAMGDYSHDIYHCDCGKTYCEDCASEADFRDEDWYLEHEDDDCHEPTCAYCRQEDVSDDDLLDYTIELLGLSKDSIKELYIKNKTKL